MCIRDRHKKNEAPDAHATFSVKIEVLRVADGGQDVYKRQTWQDVLEGCTALLEELR